MSGTNGSGANQPAASSKDGGFFGGLVGFLSATGGLVFVFVLLMLLAIVMIALAAIAWLRRAAPNSWAARASRLTFRPRS